MTSSTPSALRLSLFTACLFGCLCGALGTRYFLGRRTEDLGSATRDRWAGVPVNRIEAITNGPWGELRYWYSVLEMHPTLVQDRLTPPDRNDWHVVPEPGSTVAALLKSVGLREADCSELMQQAETNGEFVILHPTDEFILGMDAQTRARLYPVLGRWIQNEPQTLAVRFVPEGMMNWVDRSDLPSALARDVKRLIYEHGDVDLFADFNTVLRRATNSMDRIQFLRVISRQAIVMGRVVIGSDEDLAPLQAYWGRGDRHGDVQTILESARISEGRGEIPIDMLLPRFARERLYRYRHSYDPELSNCHYSSLNFFEDEPVLAFTNLSVCSEAIMKDYAPITGAMQLGDIVMFMRNSAEVVHTCNYVAGDLVFTKNGSAVGQPWRLARLPNLVKIYSVSEPITLRAVRRRDLSSP